MKVNFELQLSPVCRDGGGPFEFDLATVDRRFRRAGGRGRDVSSLAIYASVPVVVVVVVVAVMIPPADGPTAAGRHPWGQTPETQSQA